VNLTLSIIFLKPWQLSTTFKFQTFQKYQKYQRASNVVCIGKIPAATAMCYVWTILQSKISSDSIKAVVPAQAVWKESSDAHILG
jgi:hypothetical protein